MRAILKSPRLYLFIASVILAGVASARLLTLQSRLPTDPIIIEDEQAGTTVRIEAEPSVLALPNDCVRLRWQVENTQAVFVGGDGLSGEDDRDWCFLGNGDTPAVRVVLQDDSSVVYSLPVRRAGFTLVGGLALAAAGMVYAVAGWFPSRRDALRWLPVTLPLALLVGTGWYGIDFGAHWDEGVILRETQDMLYNGETIPNYYFKPTLPIYLTAASELPNHLSYTSPPPRELDPVLPRMVFLALSSLAVVWVYGTCMVWGRTVPEALLAAALLATSWEVGYHLRWLAVDSLMMQFVALAMLGLVAALRVPRHQPGLLVLAAVATGLAIGSKYPAGLLLLPLAVAAGLTAPRYTLPTIARRVIGLWFVAALTFLITTPGAVLAPGTFINDVSEMMGNYDAGTEGRYGVTAGPLHLLRMGEYLGLVLFSRWDALALVLALAVPVGLVALVREDWRVSLVYLCFPAVYVVYFSTQSLMIVRNLLVLAPFMAVLAARGFGWWLPYAPSRWQPVAAGFVALALVTNASWLAYASHTIHMRPSLYYIPYLEYVRATPEETFYASSRLWDDLNQHEDTYDDPLPANLIQDDGTADRVAFELFDVRTSLPGVYRNKFVRVFGPQEVNLDYYDTWRESHVVVISRKQMEGALLKELPR